MGRLVGPEHVADRERDVLVEEVADEHAHSSIGTPSVAQQEGHEEPELRDSDVAGLHGLVALLPADAYADVCALNHGDIVGSITDGQRDTPQVLGLDELHQLPLLRRGQSAADARTARHCELVQHLAALLRHQHRPHKSAVKDETTVAVAFHLLLSSLQQYEGVLTVSTVHHVGERHVRREQLAGPHNLHRGLGLVAGQDPEADAGRLDGHDGFRHSLLKLVLYGTDAGKQQGVLHVRGARSHLLLLALRSGQGGRPALLPALEEAPVQNLRGEREGPQPELRVLREVLQGACAERLLAEGPHDVVRALDDAEQLAFVLHDRSHPLAVGREGDLCQNSEDVVPLGGGPLDGQLPSGLAGQAPAHHEGDAHGVGGVEEGDLVGRAAGEDGVQALAVQVHLARMAYAEAEEEPAHLCMAGVAVTGQDLFSLVHAGSLTTCPPLALLPAEIAKVRATDGTAREDHLVLSEGAGLVREDKVDLAHLLHEVRGARQRKLLCPFAEHLWVPIDLDAQDELNHLEADVEADRHDLVQDDPVDEEPHHKVRPPLVYIKALVGVRNLREDRGVEAEHEEGANKALHPSVQVHLHVRHLGSGACHVQPRLGISSDVGGDRDHKRRVPQHAAPGHEVLGAERKGQRHLERLELRPHLGQRRLQID
mmetsp:Transcript_30490/g.80868  ORF Transcript_30490/g.80868 Transcript_30490/m.80868 type:complete len:654 (+) Transcript_30490:901-2862(+)